MRIAVLLGSVNISLAGWFGTAVVPPDAASQNEHGMTIVADRKQCALSSSVQVWRFSYGRDAQQTGPSEAIVIAEPLARGGPAVRAFITFVDGQRVTDSCRWIFNGLPEGEYVAFLVRPDGSGGSMRFTLPNVPATITVPPPQVVVSGVATRNGSAAASFMFRVSAVQFSRPAVVVVTDGQGRFSVSLDRPGTYEASNGNDRAQAPWVRQFTVQAGENQIALEIPAD